MSRLSYFMVVCVIHVYFDVLLVWLNHPIYIAPVHNKCHLKVLSIESRGAYNIRQNHNPLRSKHFAWVREKILLTGREFLKNQAQ